MLHHNALLIAAAIILVGGAIVETIREIHALRRYRAKGFGLIRTALTLTAPQVARLTDDELWYYMDALDYARRRYKAGILRDDPDLKAASQIIDAERNRRFELDEASRKAADTARAAAKAARARKELGL